MSARPYDHLSIHPSIYQPIHPSIYPPILIATQLSTHPSTRPFIHSPIHASLHPMNQRTNQSFNHIQFTFNLNVSPLNPVINPWPFFSSGNAYRVNNSHRGSCLDRGQAKRRRTRARFQDPSLFITIFFFFVFLFQNPIFLSLSYSECISSPFLGPYLKPFLGTIRDLDFYLGFFEILSGFYWFRLFMCFFSRFLF